MMEIIELTEEKSDAISQVAGLEVEIFPDPWKQDEVLSTVRNPQTFCTCIREDKEVLGYYLCYYVLDECEIARIAVSQKARRQGLGNQLLSHMEQTCIEHKISYLLLDVRESNLPAISFYEKNGFKRDGIRKGYYSGSKPENAILMSKQI